MCSVLEVMLQRNRKMNAPAEVTLAQDTFYEMNNDEQTVEEYRIWGDHILFEGSWKKLWFKTDQDCRG